MRVMLDTNVLVSAFLFKSKIINELINKLSNEHEIIIASYCIDELKDLIKTKFKVKEKTLNEFLITFPFDLVYSPVDVDEELFKIRDKDDYIILYTAIIEDVDILITGDKDFSDVDIERPEIMTIRDFLDKY